jgi:hypothetical protein
VAWNRQPTRLTLHHPAHYCISVQGVLDESWADTFGGLTIVSDATACPGPVTTLTGPAIDQALLLGLLNYLYDLGLPLLSVERLADEDHLPGGRP